MRIAPPKLLYLARYQYRAKTKEYVHVLTIPSRLELGRQLGFLQNNRIDQNALIQNQIPAPFSSASALFAAIAFLSTAFVSSSVFGGNRGRSLKGLFGVKGHQAVSVREQLRKRTPTD